MSTGLFAPPNVPIAISIPMFDQALIKPAGLQPCAWNCKTPPRARLVEPQDFGKAGINRVSMGIQSLRDVDLNALGRMHSVSEAREAFEIAKDSFKRVSFDLIYARQGQNIDDWKAELREAQAMAVDHLSLYQLTIEAGTRFGLPMNATCQPTKFQTTQGRVPNRVTI